MVEDPRRAAEWSRLLALAARAEFGEESPLEPFWQLYSPIARGANVAPYVVGQLGQSLDGRVATPTGHSHYINGLEAIVHLHRLRALVDAVVVGVGTAIADDPRLTVRQVEGRSPARVVIDPSGRLPPTAKLLERDGTAVYVVQAGDRRRPDGVTGIALRSRDGALDPHDIVAALAERGLRRILIEGGAYTVSAFLSAGALDRLHVCVAPLLLGSGPIGVTLPPIDRLESALRPRVAVHRLGDDVLFDCNLEKPPASR
jgi:diaminohydroxyphosphoribosylaminopyrimidine deaminase / 5-amino-6-(5-phosphoribosylamino)uracil reductase